MLGNSFGAIDGLIDLPSFIPNSRADKFSFDHLKEQKFTFLQRIENLLYDIEFKLVCFFYLNCRLKISSKEQIPQSIIVVNNVWGLGNFISFLFF